MGLTPVCLVLEYLSRALRGSHGMRVRFFTRMLASDASEQIFFDVLLLVMIMLLFKRYTAQRLTFDSLYDF